MGNSERTSPTTDKGQKTPFDTHYAAGLSLLNSGEPEKAAKRFLQAAIADTEKWCNAAIEIGRTGQPLLALGCLTELLKISQSSQLHAATWTAIGNVYSNAGNRVEAMECFIRSWDLGPHPGSAANRALVHLWNGEVSDAERWIRRSLEMNPWLPEAQFVQSMIATVGRGHYRTGFQQYECRWRSKESGLKKLPSQMPEWAGPSQSKGRLLVYGEQGMGDTILALRYARLIKELGLKQMWVIQPPVKALAESMGIIDEVKSPGEEFTDYDFHIPAISLIRCFNTSLETVPTAPYIFLGHTRQRMARRRERRYQMKMRVGICWQGSTVNRNNPMRSAPVQHWKPILDLASDKLEFHSFQVDGAEEALTYPQIQMSAPPKDWLETAYRLTEMDLVISVDTALVHLAGAMDIPCWVALHCRPYFVYPLVRDQTPWYSSLRLFKQKQEHEWAPVFTAIADELKKL